MKALGRHLLAEFYDCDAKALDNVQLVEEGMNKAALAAGANIVDSSFHRFLPYGVSGVVVISESHLTIHTWPEFGYAAVDVFTCGDHVDPWKALNYLRNIFNADRTNVTEHKRGVYKEVGLDETAYFKVEA